MNAKDRGCLRPAAAAVTLALVAACADGGEAERDVPAAERPASATIEVFERDDHIWLREGDGAERRLTAERVGDFDRAALATLQREGEVILYWAAAPVASPDGHFVAYATNREAVAGGARGQSIWLVDVADGSERRLLSEPGRSFRPIGWLGGAVLYIGDEPGVHAVDARTGRIRFVAAGTHLDVAREGTTLVVADGVPDSVSVRVLAGDDTIDVPLAPAGFAYLAQARLAPGATVLLLEAAADSGRVRRFVVFDIARRRLHPVNEPLHVDGRRVDPQHARAYLEEALGFTSRDGRVFCSWTQLGDEPAVAYVWALCEEWLVGPDSLEAGSGSSGPVALFVEEVGDSLRIASHRRPGDGDRYARDLRALFPDEARRRIPADVDPIALGLVNREIAKRCFERSSVPCIWRGD